VNIRVFGLGFAGPVEGRVGELVHIGLSRATGDVTEVCRAASR
jgi:hypothetical protein